MEKPIRVDVVIDRIHSMTIANTPDGKDDIAALLVVTLGRAAPEHATIGLSKEAIRTLYEALIEAPPPKGHGRPGHH